MCSLVWHWSDISDNEVSSSSSEHVSEAGSSSSLLSQDVDNEPTIKRTCGAATDLGSSSSSEHVSEAGSSLSRVATPSLKRETVWSA